MLKFFEYCFYRISAFYDKKVYSPPFAYSITWVSFIFYVMKFQKKVFFKQKLTKNFTKFSKIFIKKRI